MKNSKQPDEERRTKKITLEVYEDSEATFYLALFRAKTSDPPKPDDIKALLDSVDYPKEWLSTKEEDIKKDLVLSWEYIHRAGRFSDDYLKISKNNFEGFIDTDFGKSLMNLYYVFGNLKDLITNKDSIKVKTELSILSLIVNAFLNLDNTNTITEATSKTFLKTGQQQRFTLEQTSEGVFKISQDKNGAKDSVEFQLYLKLGNEFQLLRAVEELDEPIANLYLRINDDLIQFDQDENSLRYTMITGAIFNDEGFVDLSNCKEQSVYVLPMDKMTHIIEPSVYTNQFNLELPSVDIDQMEVSQQITQPASGVVSMHDSLLELYSIPDGVKKEAYIRHRIIISFFNEVSKFFPDISQYVRSIVTGYLCIPLGIIDTEENHNQTDRTQSYHEYVGKTVRNVLASKPFSK